VESAAFIFGVKEGKHDTFPLSNTTPHKRVEWGEMLHLIC